MDLHPYTIAGAEEYLHALNVDPPAARRGLRAFRIQEAQSGRPTRIAIALMNSRGDQRIPHRHFDGSVSYSDAIVDHVTVYGWRAALTAIRALRTEYLLDADPRMSDCYFDIADEHLDTAIQRAEDYYR